MEVETVSIPYESRSDVFSIYPLGDWHAGTRQCDEDLLDTTIAEIAENPNARWVGMGDYGDYINFHDPRFDWMSLAPWVLKKMADKPRTAAAQRESNKTLPGIQRDWIQAKMEPIKGKCLGLLYGNHEDTVRIKFEDETAICLADRLGVKSLGYNAYVRILFTRGGARGATQSLISYFHHGFFAGRLAGGVALNLQRMFLDHPTARFICVAHGHQKEVIPSTCYDVDWNSLSKPIRGIVRIAAMTGPFKRNYVQPGETAQWDEKKHFPLSSEGSVVFEYMPDKNKIKGTTGWC